MCRKITFFSLSLLVALQSFAGEPASLRKSAASNSNPKNVLKLNLFALIFSGINPTYERAITNRSSVGLSVNFLPSLPVGAFVEPLKDNGYSDPKASGYQITPFYRFYTSSTKGAPKGFYLEPFLRFGGHKVEMKYTDPSPEAGESSYMTDGSTKSKISTSTIGAGLAIGLQWQINNKFTIDWNIIGVGFGATKISNEVRNPNFNFTASDRKEIEESLQDADDRFDTETTNNSVKASISGITPILRTGFSLGWSF